MCGTIIAWGNLSATGSRLNWTGLKRPWTTGHARLCLSMLYISFIKRVFNMKTCFSVCVPQGEEFEEGRLYKGDRTKTPSGCGGTSTRAVRPTSRVLSRPVVGTSSVSAKIVLPLTHMTESGRGRGPVLIPKGTLVQWVEQRLGLAVGHRFESDRFHVTLSRALHKTPVRSR